MDEFSNAITSLWWDAENCRLPRDAKASNIVPNIASNLAAIGLTGPLSMYIYGNIRPHVDHNNNRKGFTTKQHMDLFASSCVSLQHVPGDNNRADSADKRMILDMMDWAYHHSPPANYVIISGDGDFSYAVHNLRMMRYKVVIIQPKVAANTLVASTQTVWKWNDFVDRVPRSVNPMNLKTPPSLNRTYDIKGIEYTTSPIFICWDVGSFPVPDNLNPQDVSLNIDLALSRIQLKGRLYFHCYGCSNSTTYDRRQILLNTGIEQHEISKDLKTADKISFAKLLLWSLDHHPPASYVVISNDLDLWIALSRLKEKGYNIMAVQDQQPCPLLVSKLATKIWEWSVLCKGGVPLTKEEVASQHPKPKTQVSKKQNVGDSSLWVARQ